jgi:hypothetical protein
VKLSCPPKVISGGLPLISDIPASKIDEALIAHVSPLGWAHIGLTGDYLWDAAADSRTDRYRPLHNPNASLQLVA